MMTEEGLPEADRAGEALHPRETPRLIGQSQAQAAFLEAFSSGRMHHAWLISGPRGVGKATFAWRLARFLLAQPAHVDDGLFGAPPPPQSLDTDPSTALNARITALSEPGLMLIRRAWDSDKKRLKNQITVDEVRRLNGFFGLSAADGGRRVVIVDSVDEMNTSAANALLKMLEEPPRNSVFLMVSHAPARLLPTIRSRCRDLRASALDPSDMLAALDQAGIPDVQEGVAELAGGSVGEALRLIANDGPAIYAALVRLVAGAPGIDRNAALKLAETAAQRGNDQKLDMVFQLIDSLLFRLARHGSGVPAGREATTGEAEVFNRLARDAAAARKWADLQQDLSRRLAHGRAVNVDAASLVLDALLKIDDAAWRP